MNQTGKKHNVEFLDAAPLDEVHLGEMDKAAVLILIREEARRSRRHGVMKRFYLKMWDRLLSNDPSVLFNIDHHKGDGGQ